MVFHTFTFFSKSTEPFENKFDMNVSLQTVLLCLPFERRETYCFSLIFSSSASASSSSASSQRSLSGPELFCFPDRSIIFGMWVHDHKAVCRVP
jgi:hypothetical protein